VNGVTATQARPSRVSRGSAAGTTRSNAAGSTLQCAKSRSSQVCAMTHGRRGIGHGRWPVTLVLRACCTGEAARASSPRATAPGPKAATTSRP
jgi:hypothetical protein